MWSPRQSHALGARCRKLLVAAIALLCLPLIAGCQFQPLYGTTPDGRSLKTVMKSVDIGPIPGRVGQRLRNELIFGTTGGGYAEPPKYKLQIAIRESITSILVETTGDAEGQLYNLSASFQLIRVGDSAVMLKGESTSRAAYDKFEQIFANTRARVDAENRAARIVADGIKTRLAAFLSGNA